ncbi:MAG: hypothetical protein WCS52_09375 [bacterium]|jgi:hypothetical protein
MASVVKQHTLGDRLGLTVHVSAFRMRVESLMKRYPSSTAVFLDDWLLDVANSRGARIIVREPAAPDDFLPPPAEVFTQEELVVAICMLQGLDRPQLLRLAAQLISRNELNLKFFTRLAVRERVGPVLNALAKEALKVVPDHPAWSLLANIFAGAAHPHDVVMHWTRLAQPVMANGRVNAAAWRLVA